MKHILCIGHRKQQGKDTAANNLKTQLRMKYPRMRTEVVALADPIYKICELANGSFEGKTFYDLNAGQTPDIKMVPMKGQATTPREALINVGQFLKTITHKTIWPEIAMRSECDFLIISDLRFLEEALFFAKAGAKFMRIDRPPIPENDAAEGSLEDFAWDVAIENNGTIREMSDKVIAYVEANFNL